MPRDYRLSPSAALIAVATALVVGIVASLAIRPPGAAEVRKAPDGSAAPREQVRWRVASAVAGNIPVVGESIERLRLDLLAVSLGAIDLEIFDPGDIVPVFGITEGVRDRKIQAGFTWDSTWSGSP